VDPTDALTELEQLRAEVAELRAKVEQHQRESFSNASLASERLGELTLVQEILNEAENENPDLRARVERAEAVVREADLVCQHARIIGVPDGGAGLVKALLDYHAATREEPADG